ncbi:MAG: FAD-binding protein [Armatimonadetes bacterium]|nr:FAD-binding protein [Armatimonadota bacterium]
MEESQMVAELGRLIDPDRVLTGSAVKRAYEHDAYTVEKFPPTAVVLPETTEEVAQIVKWCGGNQVPFTPRGAGTGLSGGAMPALGGVVISTKRMTSILEMSPADRWAHVQSGTVNLRLTKAAQPYGLHFAPDPSSQSVSTIGGNIAENSGGPHTLKYGVTTQHVLGVRIVVSGGEVLTIGGPDGMPPGYDVLSLVIGSEGTLGVVTEAWVRLTPNPVAVETALISFGSIRAASEAVSTIVKSGVFPAALEMMDRNVIHAVRDAFGLEYPDGMEAMLLVECDGQPEVARQEMEEIIQMVDSAIDVRIAQNEIERAELWKARKKGIGALGRISPTVVTHDGVIPPSKLPEMLEVVFGVAEKHGLIVGNIFHAGDGNLHPIFCFDERESGKIDSVVAAGEEVIQKCIDLGGSVTGEHGVGVEKSSLLNKQFDAESLHWQGKVRDVFGAGELCNPCKMIPDAKGCIEHKVRWRGVAT